MIHIVYMSRAVRPLSDQELQQMLDQCRRDNASRNVTGVLFYSHGNIAQLIEGDAAVLEPLFEKISRDGRHSNVVELVKKNIAARSFSDWSMAFHPLQSSGFDALEGFLLPDHLRQPPSTLTIADAMMVDLVRLAVFGPDAVATEPAEPAHA
ncbi:BLUF domain-containing protein [Hymenobacter arizonensis]|uniref:Sensors of blue-light using FAD n=1 Tax=Hymenobacter arizonensis TaxID=1227077 RepID=A0A1I6AF24_HYMAR|nr:BLUF domain-containing protein [Hymenobacter arizonensis]SFQ67308.1 Sensors of blue-light using FAD [Hymenobacter arizonensis]